MKIDGFLKVPDIPGPSVRDGHEEEIEVHGMAFNMVAPHDPNSLSRRGRVALDVIEFTSTGARQYTLRSAELPLQNCTLTATLCTGETWDSVHQNIMTHLARMGGAQDLETELQEHFHRAPASVRPTSIAS